MHPVQIFLKMFRDAITRGRFSSPHPKAFPSHRPQSSLMWCWGRFQLARPALIGPTKGVDDVELAQLFLRHLDQL
jgi:hypothetical protein